MEGSKSYWGGVWEKCCCPLACVLPTSKKLIDFWYLILQSFCLVNRCFGLPNPHESLANCLPLSEQIAWCWQFSVDMCEQDKPSSGNWPWQQSPLKWTQRTGANTAIAPGILLKMIFLWWVIHIPIIYSPEFLTSPAVMPNLFEAEALGKRPAMGPSLRGPTSCLLSPAQRVKLSLLNLKMRSQQAAFGERRTSRAKRAPWFDTGPPAWVWAFAGVLQCWALILALSRSCQECGPKGYRPLCGDLTLLDRYFSVLCFAIIHHREAILGGISMATVVCTPASNPYLHSPPHNR